MATLAQQIDDHLVDCVRERQTSNRRLTRIESILIAVAASAFLQLIALCAFLFVKAYG